MNGHSDKHMPLLLVMQTDMVDESVKLKHLPHVIIAGRSEL